MFFSVATLQTVVTVGSLLVTAHVRNDQYLWGLADVGAAYIAIAAVFTGWYWLLDGIIPGGAFVFPGRDGEDLQRPTFIDYFFISFNTNSTFGPTSETILSRRVKVLMMLQTTLSLGTLGKAFAGGINDSTGFTRWLDAHLFDGATFAQFRTMGRPRVWINASDIYNRVPFVSGQTAFTAICSDLSAYPLSDAVAASAAGSTPISWSPVR